MRRDLLIELVNWKNSNSRKPLILNGARQVGKTFLLKQFSSENFRQTIYLNFEQDISAKKIFSDSLNPKHIINQIEIYLEVKIDLDTDILILDEIQSCPEAITSLKYFCEELNKFAVCSAGSLLGVYLNNVSFPVGKVDLLDLYPMNFFEFIEAIHGEHIINTVNDSINNNKILTIIHDKLWQYYKEYLVVGGLPEIVEFYSKNKDFIQIRKKQGDLLNSYFADFSKHSGKQNAMHLERILNNVPIQLSREIDGNAGKFRFKDVIPGIDSYTRMSSALDWLVSARLVLKVSILDTIKEPLLAYTKENVFKLYFFDVGLLGKVLELKVSSILNQDYGSYKGFYAENFVAQELNSKIKLFSWKEKESEVEFILDSQNGVIPIEVKSGKNTRSKSLTIFKNKYSPKKNVKLSANEFKNDETNLKIPIYLASKILDLKSF